MPKLECHRCGAVYIADTFAEAIWHIDHGIGVFNGRICPNNGTNPMSWNGLPVPANRTEPAAPDVKTEKKEILKDLSSKIKPKKKK